MRVPFRVTILLYASGLVLLLVAAMLIFVNWQGQRLVNESIARDSEQGRRSVLNRENERLANLQVAAESVGYYPDMFARLAQVDLATSRDFLQQFLAKNKRVDLLIVCDAAGRVVARTDAQTTDPIPEAETRWVQPALNNLSASGVLVLGKTAYHAVMVPAAPAGRVFGFVLAGASIDNGFAQELAEVTKNEVVLVGDTILGSTRGVVGLPWKTQAEWKENTGGGGPQTIELAGESYAALPVALSAGRGPQVLAVLLRSRNQALEPFQRIQKGLLGLGIGVALAGIAASFFVARRVTSPIGQLVEGTKRVAEGDFATPLDIRSGDEIGDLALSFNKMMRGLRERADMKKFISHSTVEMIKANRKRDSAGEKRTLTIFFSDIRGFTTLAQDRTPEEVVRLLNSCLSLQADRVQRFRGDVDKFVGDCVVALFSGDDSTFNAIRCAVEIVKALDAYHQVHPKEEGLQVGIGIVTGEVILGSIGSEDRRDFTVIGSNVNLCARLCSLAKPREILLAESSYMLVKDLVAAERLDPQQVKGFSDPIAVYRIRIQ